MLGDTGNSCWKMPCTDLHGMTRDEPCSCSISCRRINSVLGVAGLRVETLVVLVEWIICGDTTVFEDRLKNLSLDLLSPLLWK